MIDKLDEDSQEDLVHKICGGQSWDLNPKVVNKPVEELVPEQFHDFLLVFQKRNQNVCCLKNCGTMQSKWSWDLCWRNQKCIHCPLWSKKWIVLLPNNSEKATYNLQNHPNPPDILVTKERLEETNVYWLPLPKQANCQECVSETLNFRDYQQGGEGKHIYEVGFALGL
jgi:hypothetical protein